MAAVRFGDIVRVKSGSPDLLVVDFDVERGISVAICAWVNRDHVVEEASFPVANLDVCHPACA
jgi:uncharacterized protein YodC (DUF2158 family)